MNEYVDADKKARISSIMEALKKTQTTKAQTEVDKRRKFVNEFIQKDEIKEKALGVILVGSLAYGAEDSVTKKSDIDLIVVYDDIKDCAADYFGKEEADYLKNESYDGYLVKRHENLNHSPNLKDINPDDLDVSIHNLNYLALQKISYGNAETLAYYRQSKKENTYKCLDFDRNEHDFIPDCQEAYLGERRIDKVAFYEDDAYVIGNDMDKILSGAIICSDTDGKIEKAVQNTWDNVAKRLADHCEKRGQDINDADIGPCLSRYNRFSDEVQRTTKEKTQESIKKAAKPLERQTDKMQIILASRGNQKD